MPRWTKEDLLSHKNVDRLLDRVVQRPKANPEFLSPKPNPEVQRPKSIPTEFKCRTFTVPGLPVGKPRQTQRDKWKARPAVVRYREYCDRIRAASGECSPPDQIEVTAYLPVKQSWSKRRQLMFNGTPHRLRPDADNILKGICDALFTDDSGIWKKTVTKFWCQMDAERTEITVLYHT